MSVPQQTVSLFDDRRGRVASGAGRGVPRPAHSALRSAPKGPGGRSRRARPTAGLWPDSRIPRFMRLSTNYAAPWLGEFHLPDVATTYNEADFAQNLPSVHEAACQDTDGCVRWRGSREWGTMQFLRRLFGHPTRKSKDAVRKEVATSVGAANSAREGGNTRMCYPCLILARA